MDVIHLPLVDAATKDVATTADATNINKDDVSVEPLAEGDVNAEGKKTVEITTDNFSAYGFVYTVDFIHEGETFSIAGESEILLSQLFKELKINADAGHAVDVKLLPSRSRRATGCSRASSPLRAKSCSP